MTTCLPWLINKKVQKVFALLKISLLYLSRVQQLNYCIIYGI